MCYSLKSYFSMDSYYSFILLLIIGSHGPRLSESNIVAHQAANVAVSAFFVFGDSSADTGNNNFIPTTFRSNFPPYGRDFVDHMPTGRFANGKVGADYLISYLGLKETIPPYLDPSLSEEELLTGVNFASAGAGLDPFTSSLSGVVPVQEQLVYFEEYISRVEKIVGRKQAARLIQESLVLVVAGANDFIANYYVLPVRSSCFTVDQYQDFILEQLSHYLQRLHDLGVRRMVVGGMPPIGCLPAEMTTNGDPSDRVCVERMNAVAASYNRKLQSMLVGIEQKGLHGTKVAYADIYTQFLELIQNPLKFGFQESRRGCCGSGLFEMGPFCNPFSSTCPNASPYVFWDAVHCTSEAAQLLSGQIFRSFQLVLQ